MGDPGTPRPLDGVRVIDVSTVLAGPYATYQLALLGAKVIKIERRDGGDWARKGPPLAGTSDVSASFAAQNADKRSITLDLKDPRGLAIAKRLVAGSDVFVENFSPGVAARLGLGYEHLVTVRPQLVYASISGYGQDGPRAPLSAYDHVIQAFSGVAMLTGTPESVPNRIGPPMIDYIAGLYGAFAILAALRERDRTGAPQRVDVAMLDAALAAMSSFVTTTLNTDRPPAPAGNTAASGSPASGIFPTAKGLLALAANQEHQARALCDVVGHPEWLDDPRFATEASRTLHFAAFQDELKQALLGATADEWESRLGASHVPGARVRTLVDALADPHVVWRGVVANLPRGSGHAPLKLPTAGYRLNGAAPAPHKPPPRLGADTDWVLGSIGMSAEEIATLRRDGVV